MAGSLDSRKVREWQRRMTRFEEARQSVAEFCRKEGVSAQGQRVLTACSSKDLEHVVVVPTASAAFHGHAVFLGMLLQQG